MSGFKQLEKGDPRSKQAHGKNCACCDNKMSKDDTTQITYRCDACFDECIGKLEICPRWSKDKVEFWNKNGFMDHGGFSKKDGTKRLSKALTS